MWARRTPLLRRGRSSLSLAARIHKLDCDGARFFAYFFFHHRRLVTRFGRNNNTTVWPFDYCCFCTLSMFLLLLFFVPHSRSMGLNVLGYQSHFLQPTLPSCLSWPLRMLPDLSPLLALLRYFVAMYFQHYSCNSSTDGWLLLTHMTCCHAFRYYYGTETKQNILSRIELTNPHN